MDYCILNDETIIENMIVCEDDATAELFGAVPAYEGARIGAPYAPPSPAPPEPTELEQLRADVDFLAAMSAIEL